MTAATRKLAPPIETGVPGFVLLRDRILAENDPKLVAQWVEKAATATSIADMLDEPS